MHRGDFRSFVPAPGQSRIAGSNAREHARNRLDSPRAQELFGGWKELAGTPFRGITTGGTPVPDLFSLKPEGAPVGAIAGAARALLQTLSASQIAAMQFAIDSEKWRTWQNTEIFAEDYGLRLEEAGMVQREAAMGVVQASLSTRGYRLSRDVMKLNRFLGDLVGGPGVMNEWSYNFCLYGEPSLTEPWGWQLFGHHLCLHCFLIGEQMVLTPSFFGAEPAFADEGPHAGIALFADEERLGLELMRSLEPSLQRQATVAHSMMGGDLPEGRRHFADNLHLGGAYQDNRIVPYEGAVASRFTALQKRALLDLVAAYVATMPEGPAQARMEDVERHLADTHFCWIGNTGANDPFYYRIQSPVIFIEFDHHAGVFLTNERPEKFHVHTIVRTPNGNDYGIDLLRLHYRNAAHHRRD